MADILSSFQISSPASGTFSKSFFPQTDQELQSISPIDGSLIGEVFVTTPEQYNQVIDESVHTFKEWRVVPAPERGNIIREIAIELRKYKNRLGELVSLESGKITAEGLGEVQEAIDIADFAVGLSRQLYGKTMHSERPLHRMYEQWHPLGPVGVITAFNFPVAVWAWNAMIAAVCGDTIIWKPSELTPFSALAINSICRDVAARKGFPGLFSLVTGDRTLGNLLASDPRIPLISATGSCAMGREVAKTVSARLGRSLLELGGNNAGIVLKDADLDLCVRAILFGAVGTAGQRCTTLRRLLVEESVVEELSTRLTKAYKQIKVGDPRKSENLIGPLINENAVKSFMIAIKRVKEEGGELLFGGESVKGAPSQLYVKPTLVKAHRSMKLVKEETFAPILYIIPVKSLEEAIEINNEVEQGLSSSIFTSNIQSAERFLSHSGSDCGIANVNIGTSGAEIGGAFGGEKATGGGREAGSDSWKQYMRRQTSTINFGDKLPLAQGIQFGVE